MSANWTDFAWSMLSQTADYILSEYGARSYQGFLQKVDDAVLLLQKHPNLGAEEPLLQDRPLEYRSILVGEHNKIIYVVCQEKDEIQIMDFWDTRREPRLLKSSH